MAPAVRNVALTALLAVASAITSGALSPTTMATVLLAVAEPEPDRGHADAPCGARPGSAELLRTADRRRAAGRAAYQGPPETQVLLACADGLDAWTRR
jgi:hypothetical protein